MDAHIRLPAGFTEPVPLVTLFPAETLRRPALPSFSRNHEYKESFHLSFLCNLPSIIRMILTDSTRRAHFPSVFSEGFAGLHLQRMRCAGAGEDIYIFSNYRIYGNSNSNIPNIYHLCHHPCPHHTHTDQSWYTLTGLKGRQ